jgi:putative ABC transport system ATP-binding protein
LRDVSFGVERGEFVAIMGPSGSGKSTLMNILGCLDVPTGGEYLLDGEDVSRLDDDELAEIRAKRIGFVFQSFNLLPRASVFRNVMLPLMFADVPRHLREGRAEAALKAAAFPEEFWFHRPNQLSGGMMQRVAVARALVNDPAIILADEPTGNLDSKTGTQVLEEFCRLNEEQGRTIVMITHEEDIAAHAKRSIYVRDGQIVSDKARPAHHDTLS